MFVELVKACLTEKKYSVLEKTEHSSLWKSTCILWCVDKHDLTVSFKLCNKDVIVVHMGFGVLKQHSEKIYIAFPTQLVEACVAKQTGNVKNLTTQGSGTVTGKCDEQKCRHKVLHKFFVKG